MEKKISKIPEVENYYFCEECGSLLYKIKDKNYIKTIKPIYFQQPTEINPYKIYSKISITKKINISDQSFYYKNRQKAINLLQKHSEIYKFSEYSYFLALTYMDTIFIKNNEKTIPKKKFELYIINSVLLAAKFHEKDIHQPDLCRFSSIGINYDIDEIDISQNEIECLKILNYKLNFFSTYEILMMILNNGFIFENEIENKSNEYINIIYNYANKIFSDIIQSFIALEFNNLQIVFSVIHLTRKQFGFQNNYFNVIKKFYNIHLSDYKECLNKIKKFLNNLNSEFKYDKKISHSSKTVVSLNLNNQKKNLKDEDKKINDNNHFDNENLENKMKTPSLKKKEIQKNSSNFSSTKKRKNSFENYFIINQINKHKRASSVHYISKFSEEFEIFDNYNTINIIFEDDKNIEDKNLDINEFNKNIFKSKSSENLNNKEVQNYKEEKKKNYNSNKKVSMKNSNLKKQLSLFFKKN